MSRLLSNRPARSTLLLTLAVALFLLILGGSSLQHAGTWTGKESVVSAIGHAAANGQVGQQLPVFADISEAEEVSPVGFEHLGALLLGLFLVSLGLLLGAGLAGRIGERRLLELMRLPAVLRLLPSRPSLSALEVFRL